MDIEQVVDNVYKQTIENPKSDKTLIEALQTIIGFAMVGCEKRKVNCEEVSRIYSYVEKRFATTECKEVYRPIRTQDGKTKVRGFCGACHHRLPFNPKYEYCPYCGNRLIKTKGENK